MFDANKFKQIEEFSITEIHKVIDYLRAVIKWREMPEMYLEPTMGDNYETHFKPDETKEE